MGSISAVKLAMGYTLLPPPGRTCGLCGHCGLHTGPGAGGRQVIDWRCREGDFWTRLRAGCARWEAKP